MINDVGSEEGTYQIMRSLSLTLLLSFHRNVIPQLTVFFFKFVFKVGWSEKLKKNPTYRKILATCHS